MRAAILPAALTALLLTGPVWGTLPLSSATPVFDAIGTVQLVEGHTVHARFGLIADLAERSLPNRAGLPSRFVSPDASEDIYPGVRWFNDQYVVRPVATPSTPAPRAFSVGLAVLVGDVDTMRAPCSGALLVVDSGAPDPRSLPWASGVMQAYYVDSYLVTDPNERSWITDHWLVPTPSGAGEDVWSVAVLNNQVGLPIPDDGVSHCAPIRDGALARGQGTNGVDYPGRGNGLPAAIQYNAYFVAMLSDLHIAAPPVTHATAADGRTEGAFAGNSHDYDPLPPSLREPARFHGSVGGVPGAHETRQVDLYYGWADVPATRSYRIVDTEGSVSPYGGDPP